MPYQLIYTKPDPAQSQSNWLGILSGYKTYAVLIVAIAKIWYKLIAGHPWSDEVDNAINASLALLFGAALRSALKSSTATITGAVAQAAPAVAVDAKASPEVIKAP